MSRRAQVTALFVAAATLLSAVITLATLSVNEAPGVFAGREPRPAAAATPASSTPAPGIVAYGDSLLYEAGGFLSLQLTGVGAVDIQSFPMTAPCDYFSAIDTKLADPANVPRIAILEFSGNVLTECMRGTDGSFPTGPALAARYRTDAALITQRFVEAGTQVLWIDAPRGRPPSLTPFSVPRTDQFSGSAPFTVPIYRELAEQFRARGGDVRLVSAADGLLTANGAWVPTRPCLPIETASGNCGPDGTVAVRAPDGVHFCPIGLADGAGNCPVWSGGAWRYASSIATAVRAAVAETSPEV